MRIFGPKRKEGMGGFRRLHNGELHNLNASPNLIRGHEIKEDEIGRACSMDGRDEKCILYFGW
jgi:hypothetical protein